MGFDAFTVVLSSNAPIYFSGQQLQGFVRAVVASETSCRNITVVMRGKGKVKWQEHRNKRTYTYSNCEEYGRQSLTLWNGEATGNRLQAGNHTFPFLFVLPANVPSSFESSHGSVFYAIKAVADKPWGFDEEDKAFFNVHHPYDLNEDRLSRYSLQLQKDDTVCCTAGSISFDISSDRTGYVPGEIMYINGTVNNSTLTAIQYTEAKIIQNLVLHATDKTRTEALTVQRVYRPSIKSGREDKWSNIPLSIPAVAPSLFRCCNIIDISYQLQFIAKAGTCKTVSASTALIIGSVPLQSGGSRSYSQTPGAAAQNTSPYNFQQQGYMGASSSVPSAPTGVDFNDAPPPYCDPAPPPYEACKIAGGPFDSPVANTGSDDDEGGFAPRPYDKAGYNKL